MELNGNERVDSLITLSDRVYDAIYDNTDQGTRSRQILTLGIQVAAHTLENTYGTGLGGDAYHSHLVGNLSDSGLSITDKAYDPWAPYHKVVMDLPPLRSAMPVDLKLNRLARDYATVERATVGRDGVNETNDIHVAHLGALALPYAATTYPDLEQSKIALYTLVHDLVEAYVGDVVSLGASDEVMNAKADAEANALRQLESDFGNKFPKLVQATIDYEELLDDEARFVKSFDKMDPSFTHISNDGIVLKERLMIRGRQEFMRLHNMTTYRMWPYSKDFIEILDDRAEMAERIADKSWPY